MNQHNLTAAQQDYAIFLPAISGFYATYIGKQRSFEYVEKSRMPAGIPDMEQLNWLNPQKALFPYRWSLYSAGHANLDLAKPDPREDMIRNRDPGSVIFADSGGFQIAKGVWPGEWANTRDKNAERQRERVLKWQMGIADYGMTMDIPTWTYLNREAADKCGIHSYNDAVTATQYNNEYWIANRWGDTRILNVLQGSNHDEADHWYDLMKGYCDPNRYQRHFNGWGMGGQNMCDVHLVLKRLVTLIHDGLLEPGVHDWMHFLGTSKLEWAVLLTMMQRAVRRYHNAQFTISFDCASPFLAVANGQLYHSIVTEDRAKWSYRMSPTADNKKYATDSRSFGQAVQQDGIHPVWEDSPITSRLKISDICYYKPGDLNKIGKEGRTSWDSFSYALQMGHNTYLHIYAVQEANRRFDSGTRPAMMQRRSGDYAKFEDVVEAIFAAPDRATSEAIIEQYDRYWMEIVGTRGFKGKKAINGNAMFDALFTIEGNVEEDEEHHIDDSGFDETALENLELNNK